LLTFRDYLGLARAALASALMFMAGALIPIAGGLMMLLAPTPVLGCAVGFRRSTWRAVGVVAAASALVVFGGGLKAGLAYLVAVGLAAIAMTYMLERRQPFERIVAISASLMLVAGTMSALAVAGSAQALVHDLGNSLTAALAQGEKFYRMAGLELTLSPDIRASMIQTTLSLMPALIAIGAALTVLANLAVFWRISGRQLRIGYPLFADLVRWSTPEWLIWLLLVTGFGLFIPIAQMRTIALDCFVCLAAIYFCQGLAIMAFYFRLLAMPSLARGLVYTITVVQPILAITVSVAGVFDLWIDFRRLKPPPKAQPRDIGNFL
jgi:uncharacterized protein YybS (DUF2232 family)